MLFGDLFTGGNIHVVFTSGINSLILKLLPFEYPKLFGYFRILRFWIWTWRLLSLWNWWLVFDHEFVIRRESVFIVIRNGDSKSEQSVCFGNNPHCIELTGMHPKLFLNNHQLRIFLKTIKVIYQGHLLIWFSMKYTIRKIAENCMLENTNL